MGWVSPRDLVICNNCKSHLTLTSCNLYLKWSSVYQKRQRSCHNISMWICTLVMRPMLFFIPCLSCESFMILNYGSYGGMFECEFWCIFSENGTWLINMETHLKRSVTSADHNDIWSKRNTHCLSHMVAPTWNRDVVGLFLNQTKSPENTSLDWIVLYQSMRL